MRSDSFQSLRERAAVRSSIRALICVLKILVSRKESTSTALAEHRLQVAIEQLALFHSDIDREAAISSGCNRSFRFAYLDSL